MGQGAMAKELTDEIHNVLKLPGWSSREARKLGLVRRGVVILLESQWGHIEVHEDGD